MGADATSSGPVERIIHRGPRFTYIRHTEQRSGREVVREFVRFAGAVVVVPMLDPQTLILIRNERVPVGETLWEFPAGTLEAGEDPAVCAARELAEESGYEGATISPIGWFYTTPGLTNEKMHAYFAQDLTHVGQDLDDGERIEVHTLPLGRVWGMVDSGELRDGKSLVALHAAARRGLIGGPTNAWGQG